MNMKIKKKQGNDSFKQGWVKLDRSVLDSAIIKNPNLCQIYIWCLLKANHSDKLVSFKVGKGVTEVTCKRGQFITGRNRASEELGMPKSTFYKNSKKLENYGMINIESNNHYSIVTLVNYGFAAPTASIVEQQKNKNDDSQGTSKEQPENTNNSK